MRFNPRRHFYFILLFIIPALCPADEGMWLLDNIAKLPAFSSASGQAMLAADQIYSTTHPSLKDAVVLIGGGTGSFISPDGLVLTNHHVAYRAIQALSTPNHDFLRNGFQAASRDDELPAPGYTASVLQEIRDVTLDVLNDVTPEMSDLERMQSIEKRSRQIEREARGVKKTTCKVVEMYSGVKYYLFISKTYDDVRLIYAPPGSIGNFGGETDNWMWPRHTGDFAIFRIYADAGGEPARHSEDNVPLHPKKFLTISTAGYSDGSFVMIMGYPGRTYRYNDSYAAELFRDETYPLTIDLYKTRMDILERWSKDDRAIAITLANKIKGLANTYKNRLGMIEGFRKYNVLDTIREREAGFQHWAEQIPELKERYGDVLARIAGVSPELRTFSKKQVYLTNILAGSDLMAVANRITAALIAPRREGSGERFAALEPFLIQTYRDFVDGADKEILMRLMLKSHDLPSVQRINAVEQILYRGDERDTEGTIRRYVDSLYANTSLRTYESAADLLEEDSATIAADPLIRIAGMVNSEASQIRKSQESLTATLSALRTRLEEGWIFWKGGNVYPDANRTLRLTYGTIEGYSPHDAVYNASVTHLAGAVEKATAAEPFNLPDSIIAMEQHGNFGSLADTASHDIVTCFISNTDITGGNSGSPVLNAKGELIGVAFDGNYESITGDFVFDPKLKRTIAVDARYILFILEKFSGAEDIVKEMEIK